MSSNKAIVEGLGELAALNAHGEDLNLSAMIIQANEDGVVTAVEKEAIDKQQELVEGLKINNSQFQAMGSELDFVHFGSDPSPEDALIGYELESVVEGQHDTAHVIDILPSAPV